MKVYPKIPRFDHPVVPADFFERDGLTLVEKYDGSSFRFTLYEDRYAEHYPEPVRTAAEGDGSLVFGTRRTIRGCDRTPLEEVDGALSRAVRCLREGIDTDTLGEIHDGFDGPLVIYAENMVYSTLDYGYTEQPLPALVGFDAIPYRDIETMTPPGNPYEETFEGFLETTTCWAVFDRLRITDTPTEYSFVPAAIVDQEATRIDPTAVSFPPSTLAADVQVEGLVARTDDRRVKFVREAFRELNRQEFGQRPEAAKTGAEYVVATYCTTGRIRKQVRTLIVEEGREFGLHLNEELYPRVVEDIWAENWPELMSLERSLTPADVYPLVAERCIRELRKMQTNAELNDADPTKLWQHLE